MLWYKSWLETRWRFIIGLFLMMGSAAGAVFMYPQILKLMPLANNIPIGGAIGRRVQEAIELQRNYRGYVWYQFFGQNLKQTGTIFAVLLGTGGLLTQGAALFTLSMPVSRKRLVAVRSLTGLAELLVLALVPALLIPLFSPLIGERYGIGSALVHAACFFIATSIFFSLAFWLSTVFTDFWRPLLIALGLAMVIGVFEQVIPFGIFHVMSGESYFRTGSPPWLGLLAAAAASIVMHVMAARNMTVRDF